ncbi:hypothetical protein pdam_00007924 [Pocillopora damicornis]|uniref:Uncharacterized protein n=1 Tax=Pocillopora damicornis TaxID=46731 RepID=A0A3M6UF69_POCDA|nr:hypothetical protein pdam_00007924 [Pocillopora damicornis]
MADSSDSLKDVVRRCVREELNMHGNFTSQTLCETAWRDKSTTISFYDCIFMKCTSFGCSCTREIDFFNRTSITKKKSALLKAKGACCTEDSVSS